MEYILSGRRFFERIDKVTNQLNIQKSLLEESLKNPCILFENSLDVFGSTRATIFQIMNVYEDNERKMNIHEFQDFLCSIVNEYFAQYFKSHNIEVKVRNANSFPSIYAVYYNGSEIIQFDIFNKFYGIREIKTEEMINKEHDERKSSHTKELDYLKVKLGEMEYARNHTFGYIVNFHKKKNKGLRNKLFFGAKELIQLTFQKHKIHSGMDKLIDKYKKDILRNEEQYNKFDNYATDMKNLEIKNEAIKVIEPLFITHGYRLEKERYKLF